MRGPECGKGDGLRGRQNVEVQAHHHHGQPEVEDGDAHGDHRRHKAPEEHGPQVGSVTGHNALRAGGRGHGIAPADGRAGDPDPGHRAELQAVPVIHGLYGQRHHDPGGRRIAGDLGKGVGRHAPGHDGKGVADAYIESAYALTKKNVDQLVKALSTKFPGVTLRPEVSINKDLIGGVSIRVGDQVLDGSVRARLAQMKAALTA